MSDQHRPTRFRGQLFSFLAGLAVAGAYAGWRLREDLGNFASAINKLQVSVDDVSMNMRKVRALETDLKALRGGIAAQDARIQQLQQRIDRLA